MPANEPEPTHERPPLDAASTQPRWKGPGRLELGYQSRIRELERLKGQLADQVREARRVVELSALVERGTSRRLDRVEHERKQDQAQADTLREQSNRLLVALGALQRENELLREQQGEALRPRARPMLHPLTGQKVERPAARNRATSPS